MLVAGAFVVGWSMSRALAPSSELHAVPEVDRGPSLPEPTRPAKPRRRRLPRHARLALAGVAALVATFVGLVARTGVARAPLVAPAVAAREHALATRQAEAARLTLLRHLQLAGIAARRVGPPESPKPQLVAPKQPAVQPSERAIALDTYVQAVGTDTILRGLDASRDQLEQQVLYDPRVHIYPAGIGDVTSGKLDVRVLAIVEYLAQADGEVSVSCLITGHSLYVHGRPGLISAHIFGRAVDISAVGNVPILGHQGPGSVTERAIEQILALPASVEPLQVISLMTLGGPSFALPDHYNHIHIGY